MGWFGADKQPAHAAPEASSDGGFIAPDRTARAQCWEGRDAFFRCLDQNGIIDSVKEDGKAKEACAPELKQFEQTCASSWMDLAGCMLKSDVEFSGYTEQSASVAMIAPGHGAADMI
ncbi:hypothetical protein R9X50_00725000 [Acrodontium crateriforme]|uniref:Cytochrome c oxidase assembly factor 6 n=1 Tax=Acrodontium crateriforme TaxID=150365 RepID=A0AAQ3MAQ7_9PEZI|nr:hypothetical protein R9X50_00725000 [Acrodontium crateriforme]